MKLGARVVIRVGRLAGSEGVVAAVWREKSCGCWSLVVRTDTGREWLGKSSEVEVL